MKISKNLNEAIMQEIYSRCPNFNLPEFDEASKLIDDFNDELNEKIKALVNTELSKFISANPSVAKSEKEVAGTVYNPSQWTSYVPRDRKYRRRSVEHYSIYEAEIWNKNYKHLNELDNKRTEAYNKIIMTLELGGTKADLDRMLDELK